MKAIGGKVYLIGAGPGDPDLLTLKAVRALALADVALIDDLVDRRVLEFAPRARVIAVGKRGSCKSTPQAFIERLMVRLAMRGKIVARIKGGDPFVFGRGGEEALTLAQAGIACEVIPGITAGIGVPAVLGIPVTHRDFAHGVTFVTGHTHAGGGPDWAALARTDTTLVIYMGMKRLPEITAAGLVPRRSRYEDTGYPQVRWPWAAARRALAAMAAAAIVIGRVAGLARQAGHAGLERRRIA